MRLKEKLIGLILIVLGVWPFLLKIEAVGTYFESYKFLTWLTPGEIVFQVGLIVLGVLLIWTMRARVKAR